MVVENYDIGEGGGDADAIGVAGEAAELIIADMVDASTDIGEELVKLGREISGGSDGILF